MSYLAVLGVAKLHSNQLKNADNHNRRVGNHSHVDPERTHLNKRLIGESKSLAELIDNRQAATQARKQSNSVVAVEILISVSPEYFRPDKPEKGGYWNHSFMEQWVLSAVKWLNQSFGKNLLCADLHLDEMTPHIHIMVAPIVEKEFKIRRTTEQIAKGEAAKTRQGVSFCARDMFGPSQLMQLHDSYALALKPLGIERGKKGSATKHRHIRQYYQTVNRKPDENTEAIFPQIVLAIEKSIRSVKPGMFEKPAQFQQRLLAQLLEAVKKETTIESLDKMLLEYWQQLHHWQQKYKDEKQRSERFWKQFGSPENLADHLNIYEDRYVALQHKLQAVRGDLLVSQRQIEAREVIYEQQVKQLEDTNVVLEARCEELEGQCYELEQEFKPASAPSLG